MGAITRQRASVVCVHEGALLCVRLRDPATLVSRLFVPGGKIEPGESAAPAAEREAREETGYEVVADPASEHVARYLYEWNRVPVWCETHFFRARLRDPSQPPAAVHDADYHQGVVWLPLEASSIELAFSPEILAGVTHVLNRLG